MIKSIVERLKGWYRSLAQAVTDFVIGQDDYDYDEQEEGIEIVFVTYYFLLVAKKHYRGGVSQITAPAAITVERYKYTKFDAELMALRHFDKLDDRWKLEARPLTYECYLWQRDRYIVQREILEAPVSYSVPNS